MYYLVIIFSRIFSFFLSRFTQAHFLFLMSISFVMPSISIAEVPMTVQLANIYQDDVDVRDFLVSEKYDGIRAIWKNGELRTRNGNLIHAPEWFTRSLPDLWLDGELWSKRQDFEFISSTVRQETPSEEDWRKIKYMVFDAPDYQHPFSYRVKFYTRLLRERHSHYVQPVKQYSLNDNVALSRFFKELTDQGAEGVMLHKKTALFQSGRTDNLLKLKPYMDAEALVIGHLEGKGKYEGMLGALLVQWQSAEGQVIRFKIGSGFSDKEREVPPAIGDTVTFKYHGLTKNNVPRFASYLRIREKVNTIHEES